MNIFTKHQIGFSLLTALMSSLFAATPVPIECRFVALNEAPPVMLNIAGETSEAEIKVMRNRISAPTECFSIDGKLQFFDAENRKLIASLNIPSTVKKATLIFLSAKDKGQQVWKIYPVQDTAENFPPGGTYVVNLHAANIRFILGETKEVLKPMQSKGFAMPTIRDDFNMAPVVFQFKNKKDEWVNGKETSYRFIPAMRYLLVAYIDPRNQRPRVMTFKDPIRFPTPSQ